MLRTNLWLVPAVEVIAAVALFAGTTLLDRAAYRGVFEVPPWVISGSADGARQILTAIAAKTYSWSSNTAAGMYGRGVGRYLSASSFAPKNAESPSTSPTR